MLAYCTIFDVHDAAGLNFHRMQNLKLVDLPDLFDLLAEQTAHYMKMVTNGATREEFEYCQQRMKEIQMEIEQRKKERYTTGNG
jgi:hypothetical protein